MKYKLKFKKINKPYDVDIATKIHIKYENISDKYWLKDNGNYKKLVNFSNKYYDYYYLPNINFYHNTKLYKKLYKNKINDIKTFLSSKKKNNILLNKNLKLHILFEVVYKYKFFNKYKELNALFVFGINEYQHIDTFKYIQKKYYNNKIFNYMVHIFSKYKYIKVQKCNNNNLNENIINYNNYINLNLIKKKGNFNIIIQCISNSRKETNEYSELFNNQINFLFYLYSINKLKIGGTFIFAIGTIKNKFRSDILIHSKTIFEKVNIQEIENYNRTKEFGMCVICENYLGIKVNDFNNLLKIANLLLEHDPTSQNYNINDKNIRKEYEITKIIDDKSIFKFPVSFIDLPKKSKKYDFIRQFNINFYNKKINYINKMINYYDIYKNRKTVPKIIRKEQLIKSYIYTKKYNLEIIPFDKGKFDSELGKLIINDINKNEIFIINFNLYICNLFNKNIKLYIELDNIKNQYNYIKNIYKKFYKKYEINNIIYNKEFILNLLNKISDKYVLKKINNNFIIIFEIFNNINIINNNLNTINIYDLNNFDKSNNIINYINYYLKYNTEIININYNRKDNINLILNLNKKNNKDTDKNKINNLLFILNNLSNDGFYIYNLLLPLFKKIDIKIISILYKNFDNIYFYISKYDNLINNKIYIICYKKKNIKKILMHNLEEELNNISYNTNFKNKFIYLIQQLINNLILNMKKEIYYNDNKKYIKKKFFKELNKNIDLINNNWIKKNKLKKNKLNFINLNKINDYPYYSNIYNINDIIKNIKTYAANFIYKNNEIELVDQTLSHYVKLNKYNYTSFINEDKFIKFWNDNKDNINKYLNKYYTDNNNLNLSNAVYSFYFNSNLLYFETTIIALCQKYNVINILDVHYTTDKRIVSSLIHRKNYTLITKNENIKQKLEETYINYLNNGNEYKFIKSLGKTRQIYDLIFIDTECKDYKEHNVDKYIKYVKKNTGVVIYLYYQKIKDKIDEKYEYEIINYNKWKILVYLNKNIRNEKTYIVLSPHIDNPKLYFDNDWKSIDKTTDYVDLIFLEGAKYKRYDKIYDIKTKYKSMLTINSKFKFQNKLELFKYVKKDNPKIYKKYFQENYELNINNSKIWNKIEKLFKKKSHWIVKPVIGGGGFGVKLFNNYEECKKYILNFKEKLSQKKRENEDIWVIQEYITNPLLIKKYDKKFHFRVNFLVTFINNKLELYIFNHYVTGVSQVKFDLNNLSMNAHDTRYGTHLKMKKSDFKKQTGNYPEYFNKMFGKDKTEKIDKQMKNLFKYLKTQIKVECYEESENCFRYFGADIMVTDKFVIKMLEINDNPGSIFNIFTKYKTAFYKGMFDIVLKNKVSKHFTKC